jgi:DNA-binding NtrC family response regulator
LRPTGSESTGAGGFLRQTETILAVNDTPDTPLQRGSETVLLVEDEEVVLKITKLLLEENGYTVLPAGSGEEAIRLFTRYREPIHLLITDVVMPMLSGKDVADQIESVHPETKVLYMSGYTDDAIVHRGIVDADIQFIQKPFTERALTRKIREVLDAETPPGEASEGLVDGSCEG